MDPSYSQPICASAIGPPVYPRYKDSPNPSSSQHPSKEPPGKPPCPSSSHSILHNAAASSARQVRVAVSGIQVWPSCDLQFKGLPFQWPSVGPSDCGVEQSHTPICIWRNIHIYTKLQKPLGSGSKIKENMEGQGHCQCKKLRSLHDVRWRRVHLAGC